MYRKGINGKTAATTGTRTGPTTRRPTIRAPSSTWPSPSRTSASAPPQRHCTPIWGSVWAVLAKLSPTEFGVFGAGRTNGPVVVHCSAGVGRTGCFIALCQGLCQLRAENRVDVLGLVCALRCDRQVLLQPLSAPVTRNDVQAATGFAGMVSFVFGSF